MRYTSILLVTLMLLVVPACETTPRITSGEAVTDTVSVEIQPPANTPFDGISDALRAVYLQGYREGYSRGFPGFAPSWMRVGGRYDPTDPWTQARTQGWRDGALAARLDAGKKLRKEE
jgi:hypothetical protein